MGVRGLTTFIGNRSPQYFEDYQLRNSLLVIDGNSIACQLYHGKRNDCFGGDYDKYSHQVSKFFQLLKNCNITPLIIFDGGYETRKLKTIYSRMKNRIQAARNLNSATEGSVSVFPLFLREVFSDCVLKLGLKCVRCDFECDNAMASLARALNCPLLSFDSDFYIFDVLYIPFPTMDFRLRKNNGNHVHCQVYRIEKFLKSFGLEKVNLPLFAVMLGNDYIKKGVFASFYHNLKMQKCQGSEQQRLIKSLIVWLQNETPESAIKKILGRFKAENRKRIAETLQKGIEGYQCPDTDLISHFKLESTQVTSVKLLTDEEIEAIPEEDQTEDFVEEEEDSIEAIIDLPEFFKENYRNCLYPSAFIDLMVGNTYYCIPQVEDSSAVHSHTISLEIIKAIHKILTGRDSLALVARHDLSSVKKSILTSSSKILPQIPEIPRISLKNRQEILLNILEISDKSIDLFPKSWSLLVIALKFWLKNSQIPPLIWYSILLCAITINFVDPKIGFCRSNKSFASKYKRDPEKKIFRQRRTIAEAVIFVDKNEGIWCMKKLINYFQMDLKMRGNPGLYDKTVVHELGRFQSALLHVKHLNSLLNFPFEGLRIAEFYDGTFVYNMVVNLRKRTDLGGYMKVLLEDCPVILNVFEVMVSLVGEEAPHVQNIGGKRRRRKNKKKNVVVEDLKCEMSEDDCVFDENNAFSLLSFVKD